MNEQEVIQILKELINSKISFTLNPEDGGYKAIKALLEINEDLHKTVDQLFKDYQDAANKMFSEKEKLDEIKRIIRRRDKNESND